MSAYDDNPKRTSHFALAVSKVALLRFANYGGGESR